MDLENREMQYSKNLEN